MWACELVCVKICAVIVDAGTEFPRSDRNIRMQEGYTVL